MRKYTNILKNRIRRSRLFPVLQGIRRRLSPYESLYDAVFMDMNTTCNLRCPFCYNDWAHPPRPVFMKAAHFDKAMRLLPLVRIGRWHLSCSFEPSLHPEFIPLLKRIPPGHGSKVFFTTNLTTRFSDEAMEEIARLKLHHINISLDSLTAGTFERLRTNARLEVFLHNLERLTGAIRRRPGGPDLYYITMACGLNLDEIPTLVERCSREFLASHHEIRPFTVNDANREWVGRHTLSRNQWASLDEKIGAISCRNYHLLPLPDPAAVSGDYVEVSRQRFLKIYPDGTVGAGHNDTLIDERTFSLDDVEDPLAFFKKILREMKPPRESVSGR